MNTDLSKHRSPQAIVAHSIASDVRFRTVFEEGVVVRQRAAEVLVLNTVGIRILELVAQKRSVGEIVDDLSAEFDATKDQLRNDVSAFIGELVAAGVLEVRAAPPLGNEELSQP